MNEEKKQQSSDQKQHDMDILDVIGVLFLHFVEQCITKLHVFIKQRSISKKDAS